ncbi:MAG: ABC transporter substrate-binding protein [Solirubrobacteraceae bacterium]
MLAGSGKRSFGTLLCAATLGLAACGGDEDERGGGTVRVAYTSLPNLLDPALANMQESWQALWTVYTPLLTYEHAEGARGATVVPGLAEKLPAVSADGRVYRLRLRSGLKYSDGTAVKASDFEHTIKRVLNLESSGASFFEGIAGAQRYITARRATADLAGITTDDATRDITIRLTRPDGRFAYILASQYAALVPSTTPFQNRSANPPPGVGPYRLANVRVNRGFELVRVAGFDVPGQAAGKLDRIEVSVVKDRRRQTQDTIDNKIDYMSDPPAPDQLRAVRGRYGGERYKEVVTNSTFFYFLNHDVPPFDKPAAREAVNHAIDKRALARLFGGLLEPGCNFLPPDMKGYERIDPCPWGDPRAAPDLAKARALVKRAGVAGQEVTVWGEQQPEPKAVAEYLSDVLNEIGFEARPRIVASSVYFATIGNRRTRAQAGFANWYQDFPHPANFLLLVDGASIQPTNSVNLGNVDDPQIDALLDKANTSADIDAVADDYAKADRLVVERAHLVPYGHRKLTVFTSERVDFDGCTVWHPVYALDFTQLCLKPSTTRAGAGS